MKIVFLGIGDAFDENYLNTSILVESKTKILLDCGPTIPFQLWKYNPDPDFLDALYISHFHADHYFGIPTLFTRWCAEGRTKPVTVIGQKGVKKQVSKLLELGYKELLPGYKFQINYIEVEPGKKVSFNEFKLDFIPVRHFNLVLGIKMMTNGKILCYSGDGELSEETKKFYSGADLLIHEAFLINEDVEFHSNVKSLIEFSKENKVKLIALVHLKRTLRKDKEKILELIRKNKVKVILPEIFQEIVI